MGHSKHLSSVAVLVASSFAVLISAYSAPANAQSCSVDADCGEGYTCLLPGSSEPSCATPPCSDGAGGSGGSSSTAAEGYCEKLPETCSSDADCAAWQTCQAESAVSTCTASSDDPNPDCTDTTPDPNAPKYCVAKSLDCETDADCPESFECTTSEMGWCNGSEGSAGGSGGVGGGVTTGGAAGSDCGTTTVKACTPKEVTCAATSDCPSDWTCESITVDCPDTGVGTGGATSSGGASTGTKTSPLCEPGSKSLCIPAGYYAGTDGSLAAGSPESTNGSGGKSSGDTNSDSSATGSDSSSSDDSGCSVNPRSSNSGVFALALAALAVVGLRRRR